MTCYGYNDYQCMTAPAPGLRMSLALGRAKARNAVAAYTAVVVMRGSVGWTAKRTPAMTGAMTPARRESAADVPHAVPRILVPKVSGVIPSVVSQLPYRLTEHSVHGCPSQGDEHGGYSRRDARMDLDERKHCDGSGKRTHRQ